jgi:hypothetical protein
MRFHVLAVFSREPNEQKFQDRFLVDTIIDTSIVFVHEEIKTWLRGILREEPMSTKLLSISHTRID